MIHAADANNLFAFSNALPNFGPLPANLHLPANFHLPNFANLPPPPQPLPIVPGGAVDPAAAAAAVDMNAAAAAAAVAGQQPIIPLPAFHIPGAGAAFMPQLPFAGAAGAPAFGGFPLFAPFAPAAPPAVPPALEHLSDAELRRLEGHERQHVVERLRLLRNVQLMLDAASVLMGQYTAAVAALPPMPTQPEVNQGASSSAATLAEGTAPSSAVNAAQATATATTSTDATFDIAGPSTLLSKPPVAVASTSAAAATPTETAADTTAAEIVRLEDLGSEEHIDRVQSAASLSGQPTATEAAASELRRRRLERFMQSEQQQEQ